MLQIQQASVFFEGGGGRLVHALDRVSVDIAENSIVVALGASGCGKSTLLNAIAGFMPLSEGAILLDGVPVTRPGADRGVVFQKDALLPWRNVVDNVALGLEYAGIGRRERRERARAILRLVHLADFAEAEPHQLSGGMRQRVGLARALATDPKVLLMDEPFGALDSLTREQMQALLIEIWAKTAKQIFFITHSIEEAILLGTTVLVMSPRPGRVVERRELDYVRRLAGGDTVDAIRAEPGFVRLHEDLRRVLHAGDAAGRLQ
ncbi:ABC transporter ATP-binding protein [Lichenihabitans sp. Uapishka_5]|uniref:taurine ABC transporter ATP-binding protein n=1 Tax=Lichenihabitans sp. Uapishka_5 TaxID=3037302 RepID=UPI0029E826F7|nr:ABC transporter ATP-binding protein [Lichenihabitans sp. Uapishka_5]MDX7951534.1 ABC transporter ATP-binding protein [Lichenihabitans sp. Uapishka_5]